MTSPASRSSSSSAAKTPPSSRSKLTKAAAFALAALPLALGCGASRFRSADAWPEQKRLPDGVALDRSPAPLEPAPSASSPGAGEVPLVPPPPPETGFDTLRAFLEAVVREEPKALEALFASNATWSSLGPGGRSGTTPLLNLWRERFRRLNYGQLAEHTVVRYAEVEVLGPADIGALPPERKLPPFDLGPRDLMLRVHILVPRIGPERLFGDDLLLWLRPVEGRFVVQGSAEDFSMPLPRPAARPR